MKNLNHKHSHPVESFFSVLFGGLILLFIGIGVFNLGIFIWKVSGHKDLTANVLDSVIEDKKVNAQDISSVQQRYSALQEEDVINSAQQSLPSNVANHVTANAYIVKDLTTGQVIAESNPTKLLPIASLSKLVTAVIARKSIPDNARITLTKSETATYGNTADLVAGETFSSGDLLYPLLLVSSNDVAEAYAQFYGRTKFIQEMNNFVQSIGAYRTYFADPSGLNPNNVSTVNDMALIVDWIRKNDPTIFDVTELKSKTVRSHTWVNPTHFLSWSYYIGGKNGYLPEANRTTASLFKLGSKGDIYTIIALGSESRDADIIQLLKKIKAN